LRPYNGEDGLRRRGGLDVGDAVAVEAGSGDGLGKDNADGDENGAGAGSVRDGDFDTGAQGIDRSHSACHPCRKICFYSRPVSSSSVGELPTFRISRDSRKTREQWNNNSSLLSFMRFLLLYVPRKSLQFRLGLHSTPKASGCFLGGACAVRSGGTGKAEAVKPASAGIWPEQCPEK
jgi:hypothetical protein